MLVRMSQRSGTAAQWTAINPVLRQGEIGYESDTDKVKFGDGESPWTALPYLGGSSGDVTNADVAAFVASPGPTQDALTAQIGRVGGERLFPVEHYGAFGTDQTWQTNRDTMQAANNAAAALGGGIVTVPPGGPYFVKGVLQDSHVHIDFSDATLKHPDGDTLDIIRSRTRTTTGTITAGSRTLTVANATGIEPGCIVGIRGAAPLSNLQNTTLTGAIDSNQTSGITLASVTGFPGSGHLRVANEIIAYTGISSGTLTGVTRGAYGTTAASHASGAIIGLAMRLVTTVAAVDGTTITLDADPAPAASIGVTDSPVSIGALDIAVTGTLDGTRITGGSSSTLNGVRWDLVRLGRAELVSHRAEAALYLNVAWDCTYDITTIDNSVPEATKGACLWLFQQCHRNDGIVRIHGDIWSGLYLDNRTSLATEWDGPCDGNSGTVILNATKRTPWISNSGLLIVGGNRNHYKLIGGGTRTGLVIEAEAQANTHNGAHPPARGNKVDVHLAHVFQPWVLLEPGNVVCGYYEAAANGVNTGNSLIALASRSPGGAPTLGAFPDGTQGAPGIAFGSETNTGFYRIAAGMMQYVSQGVLGIRLVSNGIRFTDTAAAQLLDVGTTHGLRIGGGASQKLGFYGTTPVVRPTLTYSRAGETEQQAGLRTALAGLGLVTDNTTA